MCEKSVVSMEDERYPRTLLDLKEPPHKLFVVGDPEVMGEPCLSVIGARRATPYGLAVAEIAGRVAAECGVVVVSGGALGCDSAALRAAHKAGGKTVIVAGTGADVAYPRSSRDVFANAAAEGCVVSLAPWGTQPQRWAFPNRNRVIAALSRALVVTEAGEHSGTSSTAECANQLGRDIYAIPGSIFSPESRGSNMLISAGAAIICTEDDLEMRISLDYGVSRLVSEGAPFRPGRVLSALIASPMRPDDLADRLGESSLTMLKILTDYETTGVVVRLPDGRYAPSAKTLATQEGRAKAMGFAAALCEIAG